MTAYIDMVIDKYEGKKTALIGMLHEIQDKYNYLPEEALTLVASKLSMNLNDIYGVATFYKSFSLTPKGEHSITFCLGTACHVRRGPRVLDEIAKYLDTAPGRNTEDNQFYLQAVNCLGVCAIGPVMVVDGDYYGGITVTRAKKIIEQVSKKKGGEKS